MREAREDRRDVLERALYGKDLIFEADAGEKAGLAKYGAFDPKRDTRILSREAIEEIRDAFVYMRFVTRKHPVLMVGAAKVQRRLLDAYIALRELETEERRLCESPAGTLAVQGR